MAELNVGDKAPAFTLAGSKGEAISLSDLKGKNVVLYFYPKNNTPGCTLKACDFRDNLAQIQAKDTVVLGVSKDKLSSHEKFIKRFDLNFTLLSDEDCKMIDAYDSWKEKSMFGKKYMGIVRNTFLIDKKGTIKKIWRKVKVMGHVKEVLKAIDELNHGGLK